MSPMLVFFGIFGVAMLAGLYSQSQKILASLERIEKRLDDKSED